MTNIGLTELDDRAELIVDIAGKPYGFSEVPLARLADLQEFIRRTVPHPVLAIRPYLDGLKPEDRQALLENARQEARDWPPQAGTARGNAALLSTEPGQILALRVGLATHHPGLSEADVVRLYRELTRDAFRRARAAKRAGREPDGEGLVTRIFSVITGMGDPALDDGTEPIPEA